MEEQKRVLQVNLDGEGGAFSLIYQLQKKLISGYVFDFYWMGKFHKNKYVDSLKESGSKFFEANIRKNRLLGHLLTPFLFYKFLKVNHYDIVHINADTAFKLLIYAKPAKKAGCKKVIIHSHSSGINGSFKILKYLLHYLSKPFLLKSSDVYLTCSNLASKWMFKNSKRQALMIKNGIDIEQYSFSNELRKIYREKLKANNKIVVGMVGNLSYQKNPEFLIKIIPSFPKDKYLFVFIGDGGNKIKVEKLVNENGMTEQVVFLGQISNVNKVLNAFDIYVMPSRFEGFPVSGVEAQANGLKCIFSEKITKEIKLLPTTEFASIDNEKIWEDKIKNAEFPNRTLGASIVSSLGFDINDSACKLKKIYEEN